MEEILTAREAADFLKMNERTVLKLASEGRIPAARIGRRWRFEKNHIMEWIESRMGSGNGNSLALGHNGSHELNPALLGDLPPEAVSLHLTSRTRNGALEELVELVSRTGQVVSKRALLAAVTEREEMASTGVGEGVAFPHPRVPSNQLVKGPCVAFGRSERGIDYHSVDSGPTYLFFLVAAPEEKLHLQLLARLNRVMRNAALKRELMEAQTPEEAIRCIAREEERLGLNGG